MKASNKDRIIEISKKLGLSHIGSNLSCLPILEEIYAKKRRGDIVILDNAHAHLAHLVVNPRKIRSEGMIDIDIPAERLIESFGIHCDRQAGCDASGGSLGHGIGIGIGYAVADRKRDVYVIVSDGSMMEGSNWEALRIIWDLDIPNIHIHANFNGYTAVVRRDPIDLWDRMKEMSPYVDMTLWETDNMKEFEGVQGHYKVL